MIVSQFNRILLLLDIERPAVRTGYYGRKFPSHVVQRSILLGKILDGFASSLPDAP